MTALVPGDRERLVKLLAMLGSDHAGGRDSAGLAAMRLLRRRKLSWCDVIGTPSPVILPRERAPIGWRRAVAACLEKPGALRPWEVGFLHGLPKFPRLSPKQDAILREISERLGLLEEAA